MEWRVEITDDFRRWWSRLTEGEQEDLAASAILLSEWGPYPRFPHSSWINASRHRHMREIRIRSGGHPFRLMYAFDPKRVAIVLVGGEKGPKGRCYQQHVTRADWVYDRHLRQVQPELDHEQGRAQ